MTLYSKFSFPGSCFLLSLLAPLAGCTHFVFSWLRFPVRCLVASFPSSLSPSATWSAIGFLTVVANVVWPLCTVNHNYSLDHCAPLPTSCSILHRTAPSPWFCRTLAPPSSLSQVGFSFCSIIIYLFIISFFWVFIFIFLFLRAIGAWEVANNFDAMLSLLHCCWIGIRI